MDNLPWPDQARLALMRRGANQLRLWLCDIARTGILDHDLSEDSLSELASRMVDAKLGSIARRLRQIASFDRSLPSWSTDIREELAQMYLFVRSFDQLEEKPISLQWTMLTWAGYNLKKDAVRSSKGIRDIWYLVGQRFSEEEQLRSRRAWMIGANSKRYALILDFVFGRMDFAQDFQFNTGYQGIVNYYPGSFPMRGAIEIEKKVKLSRYPFPAFSSIKKFQMVYAQALAKNPWLGSFPCSLQKVIVWYHDGFWVSDQDGKHLPLSGEAEELWPLVAIGGGLEITLFGTWNGSQLRVQSYLESERIIQI